MEIADWINFETIAYKLVPVLMGLSALRNTTRYTFNNPKLQNSPSTIVNIFNSFAGIDFVILLFTNSSFAFFSLLSFFWQESIRKMLDLWSIIKD